MENAKYVRMYADENGESHFEDVETELIFMDFAPPAAPLAIAPFVPAANIRWLGAPVGWEGDVPHPVPTKSVFVITAGEAEITTSDGDVRTFTPGAVLLLEDTWGKGHRTRITSSVDAVVMIVALQDPETTGA